MALAGHAVADDWYVVGAIYLADPVWASGPGGERLFEVDATGQPVQHVRTGTGWSFTNPLGGTLVAPVAPAEPAAGRDLSSSASGSTRPSGTGRRPSAGNRSEAS